VVQLTDQLSTVVVHCLGEPREPRHLVVRVDTAHAVGRLALRRHVEVAGDDQRRTAACPFVVHLDQLVGDEPVLARARLRGRGLEHAAGGLERADAQRSERERHGVQW
jgi:hypothetical protein